MLSRLFIAGPIFALILRVSDASANPLPTPPLVSPVGPACISSPFGRLVLASHPRQGTYHNGVDRGDGVRQGGPYPEEGSRRT
jgi:hypothetical protein